MIHIGYGKAHFPDIIKDETYYIDRTDYIERLEKSKESYVIFLRPRRFGKSLWVSILRHYYDVQYKDQHKTLFGNYYIGKNPTALANSYLILSFDFSGIDAESKETVYADFLEKVRSSVDLFLAQYNTFFTQKDAEYVLATTKPNVLVSRLFELMKKKAPDEKIYLLIDEYDHFANQLMAYQLNDFKEIVSKGGFVRVFYETLKTAAMGGIIKRLFITGVSPITLDSLTSGFNIATDLSLIPDFHNMMGFTDAEVRELLQLMGVEGEDLDKYNDLLRIWYDGYKFHHKAADFIYNPDMVIYFAAYFNRLREAPSKMLDTNIASSYGRIRSMFQLLKRGEGESDNLRELLEKREIVANITRTFNPELNFSTLDFRSLLFYMGLLTFKDTYGEAQVLKIPNRVIEQLYDKYFVQLLSEKNNFPEIIGSFEKAMFELLYDNNLEAIAALSHESFSSKLNLTSNKK